MFKTQLSIEEEEMLRGVLDGETLTRNETLLRINSLNYEEIHGETKKILLSIAKSLFEKIKKTSDFEFGEYAQLLIIPE